MLTQEDDIDVHALHRQGWTISAIARHLGRNRRTIRAHLAGREAGVRARSSDDAFDSFTAYCAQRLADDPHLRASTLSDELTELGFTGSYPTMTRAVRDRALRPPCEPCRPAGDRPAGRGDRAPAG
jgi:transposase